MRARREQPWTVSASLLALLLLSLASIQSAVMQAAAAQFPAGMERICGAPPAGQKTDAAQHSQQNKAACPFCAAAANPPTACITPPLPRPLTVAFAGFLRPASLGPRGPPAFRPNARGPPPAAMTI